MIEDSRRLELAAAQDEGTAVLPRAALLAGLAVFTLLLAAFAPLVPMQYVRYAYQGLLPLVLVQVPAGQGGAGSASPGLRAELHRHGQRVSVVGDAELWRTGDRGSER